MKKMLCLLVLPMILASCSSFEGKRKIAQFDHESEGDSKTTKVVGATYICGTDSGGYALKTTEPVRLWQLSSKEEAEEGLELKNVELETKRCPNCFTATGTLAFFGQEMQVKATTSGMGNVVMNVELSAEGKVEAKLKMECDRVKK
jgi:hypothetical protein